MDRGGGTVMLKLGRCARCQKGDVALDRDQYGWYEYCLQCGYVHDLADVVEPGRQRASGAKERQPQGLEFQAKNNSQ